MLFRRQYQLLAGDTLNGFASVRQREVLSFRPQRQKIAVVRTPWLSRLARHVDRPRAVPIGEIENLAIGRAGGLLEIRVERRSVRRGRVSAALGRGQVELRRQGMPERRFVQIAPAPVAFVRTEAI